MWRQSLKSSIRCEFWGVTKVFCKNWSIFKLHIFAFLVIISIKTSNNMCLLGVAESILQVIHSGQVLYTVTKSDYLIFYKIFV